MRYLMIDRVERVERRRRITAVKNLSLSEDFFADHFVGTPVMPGALLIESLAQATTALLEISDDHRHKALLIMVERAKFRALVRPPDQLRIEVEIVSWDGDVARVDGTISCRDRVVADARLVFNMADAEQFYPGAVRAVVDIGYRTLLRDAVIVPESHD